MARRVLTIEGMSCRHCVKAVTEALKGVPGVKKVDVSLEEKSAAIEVDDAVFNEEEARKAVREQGYEVRG